jgi:hypothetical protein
MQLEDPMEEMQRRIQATCLHYGIGPDELGDRLFADSRRDREVIVAGEVQGGVMAVPLDVEAIKDSIRERGIEVLIVDPYVACHQVSENDNVEPPAAPPPNTPTREYGCVMNKLTREHIEAIRSSEIFLRVILWQCVLRFF